MAGLATVGMMVAPVVANEFPGTSVNAWDVPSSSAVLSATTSNISTSTVVSDKMRDRVVEYEVHDGDTVSTIANKFDISEETLLWQNDLTSKSTIKPGQTLEVLPITGVAHKVAKGDTVYSIAKKYAIDPQVIVNWPFNTYTDDENFGLAVGQLLIVPDGVMPAAKPSNTQYLAGRITPNAGAVAANGSFIWPTNGTITQRFVWYHTGLDIANASAPDILAADSGTVIQAGWPDNVGYGNRVIIDHGNGFVTLYAHMQAVYVSVGQTVNRGDSIGKMGSTGRSTGTHCHFEIRVGGKNVDPLTYLQ